MVGKYYFPDFVKISTVESSTKSDFTKVVNPDNTTVYSESAKLFNLLSKALKFKFKMEYASDGSYGRDLGNGSWTGLVGVLHRGESDVAAFAMSEDRYKAVDFGYPLIFEDVTFMTHEPEAMSKSSAIYYPFSLAVWIVLLLTLILVSSLFYLHNRNNSFVRILMNTMGSIVEKSLRIHFSSYGGKYLYLTWTFGVMFLSNSYKALLLSYLLLTPTNGIQTIAELSAAVVKGTYICMAFQNSYITGALLRSRESSIRIIGTSLTENNHFPMNRAHILPRRESNRRVAFISSKLKLTAFQGTYFISEDAFLTVMFGVATRPGFCCKKVLDRTTKRMFEAGLFIKAIRDRDFKNSLKSATQTEDKQELNLDDMSGSFIILAGGHILSLISFFIEVVHNRFKKQLCIMHT